MKEKIRANALKKRCNLSERERAIKSRAIIQRVLSLQEIKRAECISCYAGVNSEVRTLSLISQLLASSKKVAVPAVVDRERMEMYQIESLDELEKNNGFIEPRGEFRRFCGPERIDAVLVPGIAFDEKGHRIGYGKGYYDRFMKRLRKGIPLIGLAFECQIVKKIPVEEHDVRLEKIITEKRTINCNVSTRLEKLAMRAEKQNSHAKTSLLSPPKKQA